MHPESQAQPDYVAAITSSTQTGPGPPNPEYAPHPTETIQQALALLDSGRFAYAEAMCHRILHRNPGYAAAIHVLGLVAQESARYSAAVELFGRSIELQPSIADYHNNLGNALADLRRFDEAAGAYRNATSPCMNLWAYKTPLAPVIAVTMSMATDDTADAAAHATSFSNSESNRTIRNSLGPATASGTELARSDMMADGRNTQWIKALCSSVPDWQHAPMAGSPIGRRRRDLPGV